LTSSFKNAIKYCLLFFLGIAVLYFAFKDQNLHQIWLEIKTANIFWVCLSAFAVWLAHVFRALRWQMLYRSIRYRVTFWNTYHAVMVGYLANLALPRFGEVARCSIIQKTEKVPMFASIGTVITERLFDVFVLLTTAIGMIIFQHSIVSDFLHDVIYTQVLSKLSAVGFLWLIPTVILIAVLVIMLFMLARKKFGKKVLRMLVALRQGFSSFKKLNNKKTFVLYTLLIWVFYLLSMYFAFMAIPPTEHLGLSAAFTSIVFSGFAMAAPVQGGIGVFHWIVAQGLVLFGISFNDGLAYATLIHSSQILLILILGSLSLSISLSKQSNC